MCESTLFGVSINKFRHNVWSNLYQSATNGCFVCNVFAGIGGQSIWKKNGLQTKNTSDKLSNRPYPKIQRRPWSACTLLFFRLAKNNNFSNKSSATKGDKHRSASSKSTALMGIKINGFLSNIVCNQQIVAYGGGKMCTKARKYRFITKI